MAEKAKKATNNNNTILAICGIAIAVIIIIVAIVLATRGAGGINDSYFVSDGSKYVLTLGADDTDEEDDTAPVNAHLVYYYSDDAITDMKGFYEFATESAAKAAYDFYNENNDDTYKSVELNGKYVILTANPSDYEGLTATDVKTQIDAIEQLKNNPNTEAETIDEVEEETTEEVNE